MKDLSKFQRELENIYFTKGVEIDIPARKIKYKNRRMIKVKQENHEIKACKANSSQYSLFYMDIEVARIENFSKEHVEFVAEQLLKPLYENNAEPRQAEEIISELVKQYKLDIANIKKLIFNTFYEQDLNILKENLDKNQDFITKITNEYNEMYKKLYHCEISYFQHFVVCYYDENEARVETKINFLVEEERLNKIKSFLPASFFIAKMGCKSTPYGMQWEFIREKGLYV